MKISFSKTNKIEEYKYDSILSSYFDENSKILKKINKSDGKINIEKIDNIIICKISIIFNVQVVSSYTNHIFNTNINVNDTLFFTNKRNFENSDCIFTEDEIDLDKYIYSLVLTSIPLNIHKNGEKLPSGKGYRVIKEDDFNNESKENSGNVFDKLKGIDFK